MDELTAEVGVQIYKACRFDPSDPPSGGAIDMAVRLWGRRVLYYLPHAMAEATVARVRDEPRIVLRSGTSTERANFLTGQMTARLFLDTKPWFRPMSVEQRLELERAVGAWIVAPPEPFTATFLQVGIDLRALSRAFVITETSAAMRIQEVGESLGAAVTTPDRVYRRGTLRSCLPDETIRELAAKSNPRSVRKVRILDEPGRVALLAMG